MHTHKGDKVWNDPHIDTTSAKNSERKKHKQIEMTKKTYEDSGTNSLLSSCVQVTSA